MNTLHTACRFLMLFVHTLLLTACVPHVVRAQTQGLPVPESITARQGLPQGFVPGIVQDANGFMWLATRDGLCRYDGREFRVFQPGNGVALSSLGLENVQLGQGGKIWIMTDQGHVDLFDPVRESFFNFSRQPFYQQHFGKHFLTNMYPDSQSRLWLVRDGPGLAFIHLNRKEFHRYERSAGDSSEIGRAKVLFIGEDRAGTVWAGTNQGIFSLKHHSKVFTKYKSADPAFAQIERWVYALKELKNGNLLLLSKKGMAVLDPVSGQCSFTPLVFDEKAQYRHPIVADSKGNVYFFRMNGLYRFSGQDSLAVFPFQNDVQEYKSLYIDRSDVLWAGTNGQGIRKYNLRAGYFRTQPYVTGFIPDILQHFLDLSETAMAALPRDLFPYNFRYAFTEPQKMWFSAGRTPLYELDLVNRKLKSIPFPVEIEDIKRSELAISLAKDPDGAMWAMHDSLLYRYQNGNWRHYAHPVRPRIESGILQIVADRQFLWIATASRGLYRLEKASGQIKRYGHNPADSRSLSSDNIYCLIADPLDANLLWVGTFGGGLCRFDKRTGQSTHVTKQNGLPNDVVYAAIPDRQGQVWVATNQGLCQVDRNTLRVRIYTREDGLMADEFNRFHSLALPDGRIFLGGIEGITAFDPKQSNEDRYQPPVHITAIYVNNEPLKPDAGAGEPPVTATQQLTLAHDRNFLTIGFAAMQFNRSDKIRYRYQLEGTDSKWIETETPVTKYTDLRPGHYKLRLNASNTLGVWSPQIRELAITITPPWWQTWWAYLLYFLALSGLVYGLIRIYINRIRMRQSMIFKQKEVDLKEREAARLRELDEMKTKFFSNITHEFRTPLTLILGPAEQMLGEQRSEKDSGRLSLIDRNAKQLLGLINQLLDLSKLEAGTVKIDAAWGDLGDFIERLIETFRIAAQAKGVTLQFTTAGDHHYYWFDHEKLERIMNNLLPNAVKFADQNGRIMVALQPGEFEGVSISVANTGNRIPDAQLGRIFDRFYQADQQTGYHDGTGIGLAIVKELVEWQGGQVSVESGAAGFDTLFTVTLPYRKADGEMSVRAIIPGNAENGQVFHEDTTMPKILLVEDNAGLAGFISDSLVEKYQFYHARNGEEGIALALDIMPDLIISDVMMPVMDGYVFCNHIKSNLETSHIPVVLLTAKSALESRVEGLELGADDYITKPFHMPELRLRIRNLLDRQRRLYQHLRAQFTTAEPLTAPVAGDSPDPFLMKLNGILDTQLENPAFGVTELVREIGMSNSSLNRKLKTLTNLSAVELIRNYRLKKAASLLTEGTPVSEAAYAVGFDNLSYFAKCFRDLYRMTPREFAMKAEREQS